MIVLRLFLFLALAGIGVSLLLYFVRQDRRYLRLAWQIGKFSLVLLLTLALLFVLGRLILFRLPL